MVDIVISVSVPIIATTLFATIGWVVRVSSRVTKVETKQEDLPTLINTKFDGVGYKFDAIDNRLARIERAMNGSLKGH
jgi:hypothetical protein